MRVTAKVEYAVRACVELADETKSSPRTAEAIARSADLPLQFTENILADLRRGGLVRTVRGAEGGYQLALPASDITIADVIRAVEGPLADVRGLRPEELEYEGRPALQKMWIAVRANLRAVLEEVSLADVASGALPSAVEAMVADPQAWRSH